MGEYSRLGGTVVPLHYNLKLDPDLNTFVFTGDVDIDVQVNQAVDKIVLNANQLNIESIHVKNTSKKHCNGSQNVESRKIVTNIQDLYKNITFARAPAEETNLPNVSISRLSDSSSVSRDETSDDKSQTEEPSNLQRRLFANSNITLSRASDVSKSVKEDSQSADESTNETSTEKIVRKSDEQDSDDSEDERSGKRRKVIDNDEYLKCDSEQTKDSQSDDDSVEDKSDADNNVIGSDDKGEESRADEEDKSNDKAEEWKFPEMSRSDSSDNDESDSEPEPKKDSPVMFAMWAKPEEDKEETDEEKEAVKEEVKPKKSSYMEVNKIRGDWDDDDDESDTEERDGDNANNGDEDEVVICDDSDDDQDQSDHNDDVSDEERSRSPDILNVDGNMEYSDDERDDYVKVSKWKLDTELLIINLEDSLAEGTASIRIKYTGKLDDSMRGFYRTKHTVEGKDKWGAACHFEATGARKCFPCFDQPEFRSTYDISVIQHEPAMEVLSNMPVNKSTNTGAKTLVEFHRTPALPSYLVCVILGYYDSISRRASDGTRVTVYTRQGETKQGELALNMAVQALDYFKQFFGVGYTLPKMDLVAVPDFYIGAMENWGLLTFRETALMYNPGVSTAARKQHVAILVCHEIAHQWFGNLVSISWWDQLWLKEGYATWISYLAVDKLFPDMDIWSQFLVEERDAALDLDCLTSSHPIELRGGVQNPGQIDEIFDTISYSKGASVINMLYHWLGDAKFRAGMGSYLLKFKGSAVSTTQLWEVLEDSSSLPVQNVMSGWTKRQGFPLVSVEIVRPGLVRLSQSQFSSRDSDWWQLPLTVMWGFGEDQVKEVLLDDRRVDIELDVDYNDWLVVNQGQSGYCRVCYGPEQLRALQDCLPRLGTRDRLGVLSDLASVTGARGRGGVEQLLGMLEWYRGEVEWPVVETLHIVLGRLEGIVEASDAWLGYLQMCYRILVPSLDKLGWESVVGEEPGRVLSRIAVIGRLCHLGHCETSGMAWMRWRAEQRGKGRVPPDLRDPVYREVVRTGGKQEMDQLKVMYRDSGSAEERRMIGRALASSRSVDMARETLEWAMSGEVKQQDKVFIISGVAAGGLEGRKVAWAFFKENFSILTEQYKSGSLLTSLVRGVARHFTSHEEAEQVEEWFSDNTLVAVDRTVRQVLEEVRSRAERRAEELDTIVEYFRKINK